LAVWVLPVQAQQGNLPDWTVCNDSTRWYVHVDSAEIGVQMDVCSPVDSLRAVGDFLLDSLQNQGYYYVSLDSALVDSSGVFGNVVLYVNRGPQIKIGEVNINGLNATDEETVIRLLQTKAGNILDTGVLEEDLSHVLAHFESRGYPLATARVEEVLLQETDSSVLRLVLYIDKGPAVILKRVDVSGSMRTKSSFVARSTGLRPGRLLTDFNPGELQRRLSETGMFKTVELPAIVVEPDSGAVIQFVLEEEDPGTFDLVLGYLPPANDASSGSLVGSGHLALRNLFGQGRSFSIRMHRLPGQASSVDVAYREPFLFGWPFFVSGRFEGLQQDSTYGKQGYRGEVGYRLEEGLNTLATYSREVTRPGQAGLRITGGEQRIARAEAWFAGFGIRFQQLDRMINPGRGWILETNLESGRKDRSAVMVSGQDTTLVHSNQRQRRLFVTGRYYRPVIRRQVLVLGLDGSILLSKVYDQSDLYRFGGATSLRGYDEDQFLGRMVGRVLIEYRYAFERSSYAFVFFDAGYVERPDIINLTAVNKLYPGYGLGILFSTNIGMVNVSVAFNPENGPTGARIHAGLSFGL